jgi:PAS domain S-box-containing protein
MQLTLPLLVLLIVILVIERARKARANKVLLQALSIPAGTDDTFFRSLVLHISRALEADFAAVTELSASGTRLRTIAAVAGDQIVEPVEYDVAGMPCERALASSRYVVRDNVQSMFPIDRLTSLPGLRSYLGVALMDSARAPLGVLTLMHRRRLRNLKTLTSALDVLAQRVTSEMEQRRSRQALQKGAAKMQAILEAMPDLMFVQDRNGAYVDYYAGSPNQLYVSPDEFLGRRFEEVLPPDVVAVASPGFNKVADSGEPALVEYQLSMPDGARFYEARLVRLVPDKVLTIVRDVTDRRLAEMALERSRYFTQRLAETIPNVVFLYDLEERRNVYVNDRSESVLGYTAQEVIDMKDQFLRRTMHPDDFQRLAQLTEEYLRAEEGEILEHVFRFRHKNGEWRWFHRNAMVFARTADGRPKQMLGAATDITALKLAERELRSLSTRLLTTQDDERRRLARQLHDGVAQMLFGIGAYLKNLRQLPAMPADAVNDLAECGRLCDQGLSETRLLSYVLHPPLLDDVGLLAALKWFAEGLGRRSSIDIEVVGDEPVERLPLAIERDLFRVVQEGLTNVVRHSGSEKAVVRFARQADEAVLQIQDFGRGMPTPVERFNNRRHPVGIGILGMRERLRHVGGRLEIESSSQGTTLTAVVPVALEEISP